MSVVSPVDNRAFASLHKPLAITMWDFSWLERRWPGAGYEDWDEALDGLAERGYNAVRIDCYPHFVAADANRAWNVLPPWDQQDWGSPAPITIRVMPALLEFLQKCRERKIQVGLSSWFQNDETGQRLKIASPSALADIWAKTLGLIREAGLLDSVCYVDLCNEWPLPVWAPFFPTPKGTPEEDWRSEESLTWMQESIRLLRASYGEIPFTFSLTSFLDATDVQGVDASFLDFYEVHRWMSQNTNFYERVGYHFERFDDSGYKNVVAHAEGLYRSDPEYWWSEFTPKLDAVAQWSRDTHRLLGTTEGWSIVDYKDWPGLDWGWVRELNERAVEYVIEQGRWAMICTSNFCGPQFHGMWRDVAWHQRLTQKIRSARIEPI